MAQYIDMWEHKLQLLENKLLYLCSFLEKRVEELEISLNGTIQDRQNIGVTLKMLKNRIEELEFEIEALNRKNIPYFD